MKVTRFRSFGAARQDESGSESSDSEQHRQRVNMAALTFNIILFTTYILNSHTTASHAHLTKFTTP
jgi:hypothetical protein